MKKPESPKILSNAENLCKFTVVYNRPKGGLRQKILFDCKNLFNIFIDLVHQISVVEKVKNLSENVRVWVVSDDKYLTYTF